VIKSGPNELKSGHQESQQQQASGSPHCSHMACLKIRERAKRVNSKLLTIYLAKLPLKAEPAADTEPKAAPKPGHQNGLFGELK
jgi:hypothetical protein